LKDDGVAQISKPKLYWKDICNLAGVITLCRLSIAVFYPLLAIDASWALFYLLVGGISDVLDGWVARRTNTVSHTGGFIDGWVDKIFGINVAWTIVLMGSVEWWMGWLLFTREWIQIPLVPYYVHRYMNGVVPKNRPFWGGKVASVALNVTLVAGLLDLSIIPMVSSVTAGIFGMWTALIYFEREFALYKWVR